MILVIQHVAVEGLGILGDFFPKVRTICLDRGDVLPQDISGFEAIIILGGPMNVYEEDRYPFLKEEDALIKKVLRADIPLLGICLGAQLLAKAAGARVEKAQEREIGWYKVKLTEAGKKDGLFKGLGEYLVVFQWHEDTFDLPKNSLLLATSEQGLNQAFRIVPCAWGLQFHFEITQQMIREWVSYYKKEFRSKEEMDAILKGSSKYKEPFNLLGRKLCNNLASF